MKARAAASAAADALAAALLSPCCAVCGDVLSRVSEGAICDGCWQAAGMIAPPLCERCGDPSGWSSSRDRGSLEADRACGCPQLHPAIDVARALGPYEGTLRRAVQALKYEGRRSVAQRMARLLTARCGSILDDADAIVPVPLHPWRRWRRGFNQAEEIARCLPVPVRRVLRRTRNTPPQAGLTAGARGLNLRGAFLPRAFGARHVAGRCIVLLDDVSTTGATAGACAVILKQMGASEVRLLTVARTPRSAAR